MKKPYFQHQETQPLNITVDGKPYTYTPGSPKPTNISITSKSDKELKKEVSSLITGCKKLEEKVNQMYGEKIVWI